MHQAIKNASRNDTPKRFAKGHQITFACTNILPLDNTSQVPPYSVAGFPHLVMPAFPLASQVCPSGYAGFQSCVAGLPLWCRRSDSLLGTGDGNRCCKAHDVAGPIVCWGLATEIAAVKHMASQVSPSGVAGPILCWGPATEIATVRPTASQVPPRKADLRHCNP